METYFHAYAVNITECKLRKEVKQSLKDHFEKAKDVIDSYKEGWLEMSTIADGLDKSHWDIFHLNDAVYIGYSAIMPFEKRYLTKEEMDKEIYDTITFLCGEEEAKEKVPKEIFMSIPSTDKSVDFLATDVMTEEQMKKKLYSLYRLYWMMSNGYGLADLLQKLDDCLNVGFPDGMNGWLSYNDFCDTGLLKVDYMEKLLNVAHDEELSKKYKEWLYNEL